VFHLVALRKTLLYLHLELNPKIDDNCVPALLLLSKLRFLSLIDTDIGMIGLRQLALRFREQRRRIEMIIPNKCEEYLNRMHTHVRSTRDTQLTLRPGLSSQYILRPEPPLIVDSRACDTLSAASLRRNLAAHAIQNPAIVASGTKAEMSTRLKALLEQREADYAVRAMFWGEEDQNSYEGTIEIGSIGTQNGEDKDGSMEM
jgi:hypothetical protein